MEIHIGQEIRKVLEEKGISGAWLAQTINTSQRNLYALLTRKEISTKQLAIISKALEFDFFQLYTQRIKPSSEVADNPIESWSYKKKTVSIIVELDGMQATLETWYARLKKINAAL